MRDANQAWCCNLMAVLKDGGRWAVPRSGLVFRKEGKALNLVRLLPGFAEAAQVADFASIQKHFGAAGFTVGPAILSSYEIERRKQD